METKQEKIQRLKKEIVLLDSTDKEDKEIARLEAQLEQKKPNKLKSFIASAEKVLGKV